MTQRFQLSPKALAAAAVLGAAMLGGTAQAAAINIDATSVGSISFGACDFERGMTINGVAMGGCGVGAGGTTVLSTSTINFDGTWFTPGTSGGSGPVTVYFASNVDPTVYTSVLTYEITEVGDDSRIVGSFSTGWTSAIGDVPTGATIATAGTPFAFFFNFMGAEVKTAAVSAPGTAALAGLALLAAAGVARRRQA